MDTLHPIWAQRFSILSHALWLFDRDKDSVYIHFRVMDRDELSQDDFLGEVKIPFKNITLNRNLYLELSSLKKKQKKNKEGQHSMPQLNSDTLDRDKKPYLVIRFHVHGAVSPISPSMDVQRGSLFERIAVFVLGPSAAGKTYMSRVNLPYVLVANHFPIVPFVTIDGGTMRDVSENWNEMKSKCPADGFTDLFSGFFKSETGRFKMRLFHSLCRHGVNMLIPDTFADWVPGLHEGKGMKMLTALAEQGYTVIMTAVHASRVKCLQSGLSREIKEGKQYHSTYWERSIKKIESAFNRCREMGFEDRTFFIFDNTNFTSTLKHVVMPRVGVHVDVRRCVCLHSQNKEKKTLRD